MRKPLEGLKVIDLTSALNGPFCTMMLGDYGADVIKIEPIGGEQCRTWGPIHEESGESAFFAAINRSKKGVTLNLKSEKGLNMFYDLVKDADIIVENFRGGVTKRLKIDYETVKEINPRIIYGSSSGFGQYGPITHRACYDIVAQAMGGLINITGYKDQPPVKVGPSVADHMAGMYTTIGVLMAVYNREKTGLGQHIDVSMFDTVFSVLENNIPYYTNDGAVMGRMGNMDSAIAPFDVYPCKDGYVAFGAGNDKMWERLCDAIGKPELLNDPRYETNVSRFENFIPDLQNVITSWSMKHTKAEIEEIMDEYSLPCGPVLDMKEAIEHPHIKARDMMVPINHPLIGDMEIQGCVVKMSKTPGSVDQPAPLLGQHNAEVFNLSEEEISLLKEEGVM